MESLLEWSLAASLVLLVLALSLTVVRLAIGPSLPDRIVALDMIALLLICFCGVFAALTGHAAYLDIAVALALVAFLGTVAFARYVERRDTSPPAEESGG